MANLIIDNYDYDFKNNSQFRPRRATLRTVIRNIGQGKTGTVNFLISDKEEILRSNYENEAFDPLSFEYMEFDYSYHYQN